MVCWSVGLLVCWSVGLLINLHQRIRVAVWEKFLKMYLKQVDIYSAEPKSDIDMRRY